MPKTTLALIPKPYECKPTPVGYSVNLDTVIYAPGQEAIGLQLQADLAPATGFRLPLVDSPRPDCIQLLLDADYHDVGCEGYSLTVDKDGIKIRAPKPNGLFYGVQTLKQLLPPEVFRMAKVDGIEWAVPGVEIVDHPRFAWRGAHLDVSRHFMPKSFILRWIDQIALHKLNIFHFHLVDNNGWRIEIKKYPELALKGSGSDYSEMNPDVESRSHSQQPGGYYTQEDIREIVAFAADRFITVVPEIEMPGHSFAPLQVYPQYGNVSQIKAAGGDTSFLGDPAWDDVFNVEPETIRFLQDVLDEVMELFPSPFVHIGGDEVWKEAWKRNPRAQARMTELGLKDEDELQSWFIRQMDGYLQTKGRRLLGWDEILEGGLAEGATVMSWRGEEGGIAAAKAGHDVVMSPGSHTYLDHYQSRLRHREPLGIGGFTTTERAYGYEPIPRELTEVEAIHVLGAQFQLWSEWLPHGSHVEYMTWPRGCALAEVFWNPATDRSYAEFEPRLIEHLKRLKVVDVHYRPALFEPEPVGMWELPEGKPEAKFEWAIPAGPAGRYVIAFSTPHRGRPFEVKEVVAAGRVVGNIKSKDAHYRGCEVAVELHAICSGATLTATIAVKDGKQMEGEAFVFAEPGG